LETPGHGDGALDQLEPTALIGEMVAFIRRTRPTVVVTFGPEGAPTGHRDHKVVSRAATAAYFLAGLRTQYTDQGLEPHQASRLYFHAWSFPLADPKLKLESVPATAIVDVRATNERKLAAFMAHATQRYAYDLFVNAVLVDTERFALASGTPQTRATTDDLFEGLVSSRA
jgi:LmbE family N-acetylglucosaminyl deacetylase